MDGGGGIAGMNGFAGAEEPKRPPGAGPPPIGGGAIGVLFSGDIIGNPLGGGAAYGLLPKGLEPKGVFEV